MWLAQNKNPNDLFPGSKWSYIGEDKVIRLTKADGSDLMLTGRSDSVQLKMDNLPPHGHSFSGSISSFDYGTKTTSTGGAHSHFYNQPSYPRGNGADGSSFILAAVQAQTSSAGDLAHTVNIGAHSHTVSGKTENTGSGDYFSIVNAFIKFMGWYRISSS